MNTLIISGGELDYDFAERFIQSHEIDRVIAADGGMRFCYERQVEPDLILGDYDSIEPEILDFYRKSGRVEMETFQVEKDDTDTELALKKAISMGSSNIYILGATGGRMDHFLSNLYLLNQAGQEGVKAWLADAKNLICLLDGPAVIKKTEQAGKYVSFLPFTDRVDGVTLKGFKYPLDGYQMTRDSSIGVSNEIEADEASVSFDSGILIMIQSKD